MSVMNDQDIDAYISRSRALDLTGIAWDDVPRYPLSPEAVRTLRYMQDIETHTIICLPGLAGIDLLEAWMARARVWASADEPRATVVQPERFQALVLLPRA